jgi:peptidoglycan/xylan/chitin deacetylase (PgdA/CDA1 family)
MMIYIWRFAGAISPIMYFIKTPFWLKRFYAGYTWEIPVAGKELFLTFDDGPHPVATPFVLDMLKSYGAKATFFCIGKNVEAHPGIYQRILEEGHAVGNHTWQHLNGWKTGTDLYMADIAKAARVITSSLFRPPYGRITRQQANQLKKLTLETKEKNKVNRVIMWDVLSADFDIKLDAATCANYVIRHSVAGSVVVFHDSEKALPRLSGALPQVLKFFSEKGFSFEKIK